MQTEREVRLSSPCVCVRTSHRAPTRCEGVRGRACHPSRAVRACPPGASGPLGASQAGRRLRAAHPSRRTCAHACSSLHAHAQVQTVNPLRSGPLDPPEGPAAPLRRPRPRPACAPRRSGGARRPGPACSAAAPRAPARRRRRHRTPAAAPRSPAPRWPARFDAAPSSRRRLWVQSVSQEAERARRLGDSHGRAEGLGRIARRAEERNGLARRRRRGGNPN